MSCDDIKKIEARLIWTFPDENGEIADIIDKRGEKGLPPYDFTHFEIGANFHPSYPYFFVECDDLKDHKDNKVDAQFFLVALPSGLIGAHLRILGDESQDDSTAILSKVKGWISEWWFAPEKEKDPGAAIADCLRKHGLCHRVIDLRLREAKPFYLVRVPLIKKDSDQIIYDDQKVIEAICGLRNEISLKGSNGQVELTGQFNLTRCFNLAGQVKLTMGKPPAVSCMTKGSPRLPVVNTLDVLYDSMHAIRAWSRGLMENGIVHEIPINNHNGYCEYLGWLMNRQAGIISSNLAAIVLARWVRHILSEDSFCRSDGGLSRRSRLLRQMENGMRMCFEHHVQVGSLAAAGLPPDTREALDAMLAEVGRRIDCAWSELLFDAIRVYNGEGKR